MIRKLVWKVKSLIYGAKHLNTRHVSPKIGQVRKNAKGETLEVMLVLGDRITVRISGPSYVLVCTDYPINFRDRVDMGRYWLETKNVRVHVPTEDYR